MSDQQALASSFQGNKIAQHPIRGIPPLGHLAGHARVDTLLVTPARNRERKEATSQIGMWEFCYNGKERHVSKFLFSLMLFRPLRNSYLTLTMPVRLSPPFRGGAHARNALSLLFLPHLQIPRRCHACFLRRIPGKERREVLKTTMRGLVWKVKESILLPHYSHVMVTLQRKS